MVQNVVRRFYLQTSINLTSLNVKKLMYNPNLAFNERNAWLNINKFDDEWHTRVHDVDYAHERSA